MSEPRQTVFVVDDDEAVRESLAMLLRSVGIEFETYPDAAQFLASYDPQRSGCLVLDIRMPAISGLDLQSRLQAMEALLPIIFITGHGDIPMAVRAIQNGAVDFIQKPFHDQALLDRIQQALRLDADRRREIAQRAAIDRRLTRLSPREREVLDLVVSGQPNKVIASKLGLSQRTVEIHRAKVMQKMEASSLAQLVEMVVRSRAS
ncbi:MAG: response regulator [Acidobacteriota bacterium]